MKTLKILGEDYEIIANESGENKVDFTEGKIFVRSDGAPLTRLLKEALSDWLYAKIVGIYEEIKKESRIDLLGNLRFEITEKIDKKRQRIAKIKENKIIVKINAISLPKKALEYIIVHEMAHLVTKKHNDKFWKIVETIYPEYEQGEKAFKDHEDYLSRSIVEMLE